MMVDYEQRDVLQPVFSGQELFWSAFSDDHGQRIRAPYPGAQKFRDFLPTGDYGDPDHRMEWFEDELYPNAKEWLESLEPNGIDVQTLLSGGYGI